MNIAVNVSGDEVGGGLGRAATMAVAAVEDGAIASWTTVDVGWDASHDQIDAGVASEGGHHARIVRFMREHEIRGVVTGHAGPPMVHTLGLMGIHVFAAEGDAREAALAAAAVLAET
ncbi:MAG: hypothetical protein FWC46_06545 [Actinomycetia bacterium]|nr:hypothetical protein [Actinomycetes bacterium]